MADNIMDLTGEARKHAAPAVEERKFPEQPPREVPLKVSYLDKQALVQIHVPEGAERNGIARMSASLCGGLPWDALQPADRDRFQALALVAHCVTDMPDWMNVGAQEDNSLLFALSGAIEDHSAAYFRFYPAEGDGAEGLARVVVEVQGA